MPTSTPLRRSMYGLGAAAVLTLTLAGTASAEPGPPVFNTWKAGAALTVGVPTAPAPRPHNPGPPSYNSTWPGWSSPSTANGRVGATGGPSGTLQYLQIGLGALGGAALASAGVLTIATRTRRGRLAHA
ncbi:MAG TPA: hypothetical protein VGN19_09470 [Pedococcus sp.]|jgi:hypothetical protein|nr:hypothetical protein [Pedococcus sp.]